MQPPETTTESLVDDADAVERLRHAGRGTAPCRPRVLGGEHRAEVAGRVAARAVELERLDRLALRERVSPVPAGVTDGDGGACAAGTSESDAANASTAVRRRDPIGSAD